MTEDEMVGWHHRLDGHEFEQPLGVGDGQGGLACCSPWGRKELNMTEQLNCTETSKLAERHATFYAQKFLFYILVIFEPFCSLESLARLIKTVFWASTSD